MEILQVQQGLDGSRRTSAVAKAVYDQYAGDSHYEWMDEYFPVIYGDLLRTASSYRWIESGPWRNDHFVSTICIRLQHLLYAGMQLHEVGFNDVPTKESTDFRAKFQEPGALRGFVDLFRQNLTAASEYQ